MKAMVMMLMLMMTMVSTMNEDDDAGNRLRYETMIDDDSAHVKGGDGDECG